MRKFAKALEGRLVRRDTQRTDYGTRGLIVGANCLRRAAQTVAAMCGDRAVREWV